ncbi:hypothetical protein CEUSTIGMA_g4489.t1 [Chlamydomonas eustigma]|uniref:ApaG domain-containing protein n=1 Tax=Chlamydomonas eustigma TaxID=1157962 RepID=A0A250X2C2_9CHLO|nr:hypothetical protein CEUSTIGMA_g4489.t1 [Chlamydomonas eustigma]|eukprot:GAX77042.1 hypothetical protein CEUSTIGMA_g4489.t1 [Chlamydomonas eustigma]
MNTRLCVSRRTVRLRGSRVYTSQQSPSTLSQYATTRKSLIKAIDLAVKKEDYASAALLKRDLEALNTEDPYYALTMQLQECINEERFQEAAKHKAELKALELQLGPQPVEEDVSLQCSSNTVTNGVRVQIESTYRPLESSPTLGQYFFSYHVKVTNESDKVVQLRQRHWVIRDSTGKKEEVRGPGVVGKQPILLPGKSFEYDSACPLTTPVGSMEGEFQMWILSEDDGQFKDQFGARIDRLKLSMTGS